MYDDDGPFCLFSMVSIYEGPQKEFEKTYIRKSTKKKSRGRHIGEEDKRIKEEPGKSKHQRKG